MTAATTREPRTERGRRTRDGLISAARTVFERQGFAATRMGDIAAEAGVSHGTVYTYFDTKEDVLAATMEQLIDQLIQSIRGADLTDPVARIANANERYLSAFSENAALLRVVEEVAVTDQRFSAILDDLRDTHVRRVAAQIRRQQRDGTVHPDLDPQISAAALCAMVEGFSRHWADPLSSPADPMGQATLTLLWQRALGLPAPTPAPTSTPTDNNHTALEETDAVHR